VTGPAGTVVTLRHAEILNSNGSIYTDNLRSAKATDQYTLKGDSNGEVYEPRFTYHGFRFVEISGFPGVPTLDTLEGHHISSSVENIGSFSANTLVLNQIQRNILWGQSSNLMSVPTDCDQRDERLGWMADAQLSSAQAIYNFDLSAFYSSWARLMQDDEVSGQIADVVPFVRFGARPGDPAWSAAFPIIVYEIYKRNNDLDIISNRY
jgi:alpha-L-rhamnosidase